MNYRFCSSRSRFKSDQISLSDKEAFEKFASLCHWLCAQCDKKSDLAMHSETTILVGKVETIPFLSLLEKPGKETNYNPM